MLSKSRHSNFEHTFDPYQMYQCTSFFESLYNTLFYCRFYFTTKLKYELLFHTGYRFPLKKHGYFSKNESLQKQVVKKKCYKWVEKTGTTGTKKFFVKKSQYLCGLEGVPILYQFATNVVKTGTSRIPSV